MAEKKQPIKYTKELLDECVIKDEAELVGSYVDITRNSDISYVCKCGNHATKMFRYIVENAGLRCMVCSQKEQRRKIKETSVEKYGVPSALNLQINKDLCRESVHLYTLERLIGLIGSNLLQTYKSESLTKDTSIEFTCHKCKTNTNKIFRLIFENGGPYCSTCTEQNKQEKIKSKMKEIYGVEYSLQVPEINDKATIKGLRYKEYIGPSGRLYYCQGYEPFALDLVFIEYTEEDIITSKKKVPEIWWIDGDGKDHRYYVDIYIPKEKRMIEVKSDYRFELDKDKIEFVWRTCVEQGYNYEVWIFNKHHEIIDLKHYSSSSLIGPTSTSSKLSSSSSDK
jgi:hypothetical protein